MDFLGGPYCYEIYDSPFSSLSFSFSHSRETKTDLTVFFILALGIKGLFAGATAGSGERRMA